MRMRSIVTDPFLGLCLTAMIVAPAAQATGSSVMHSMNFQEKVFSANDDRSCHLKRFALEVFDHESINERHPGRNRNTFSGAFIQTSDPSCILNYAVVQFIRGCVYTIDYDPVKKTSETYAGESRESRGRSTVPFVHRKWEVDSIDIDPMYASSNDASTIAKRMGWQYTSKIPLGINANSSSMLSDYDVINTAKLRNFLQNSNLATTDITFTTDTPTSGNFDPRNEYDRFGKYWNITNTSVEFKTCVYNVKDIPVGKDPKGFDVAEADGGPITCLEWDHKNNFNFETKQFEKNKYEGIDPFCATAPYDANLLDLNGRQMRLDENGEIVPELSTPAPQSQQQSPIQGSL